MKLESTKIFKAEPANKIVSVIGIVGAVDYARMAMQECEGRLAKLPKGAGKDEIRGTITEVLREICAEPHQDFELLVAIFSYPNTLVMFKTNNNAVCELFGYECLGSGSYLGHFLMRDKYGEMGKKTAKLEDVLRLAVSAWQDIKGYDDGCGGVSELAVLWGDGRVSDVVPYDISKRTQKRISGAPRDFRSLLASLSP